MINALGQLPARHHKQAGVPDALAVHDAGAFQGSQKTGLAAKRVGLRGNDLHGHLDFPPFTVDHGARHRLRFVERNWKMGRNSILQVVGKGDRGEGRIDAQYFPVPLEKSMKRTAFAERDQAPLVSLEKRLRVSPPGQDWMRRTEAALYVPPSTKHLAQETHPRRTAANVHRYSSGQEFPRALILIGEGRHHEEPGFAHGALQRPERVDRAPDKAVEGWPGRMHHQRGTRLYTQCAQCTDEGWCIVPEEHPHEISFCDRLDVIHTRSSFALVDSCAIVFQLRLPAHRLRRLARSLRSVSKAPSKEVHSTTGLKGDFLVSLALMMNNSTCDVRCPGIPSH